MTADSRARVAAVAMVRNECDIIESFLRINAREVDDIYVVNHASTDPTGQIIDAVAAQLGHIHHLKVEGLAFQQADILGQLIRQVASLERFEYFVLLDADEFIAPHPQGRLGGVLAARLRPDQCGLAPWKTYVPVTTAYFESAAPMHECFRPLVAETNQFYKVIIGNEFAKTCAISEGNHIAQSAAHPGPPQMLDVTIQHAPVRSAPQITRKALIGSHTLAMKANRKPREGLHWDLILNTLRERNFKLTGADLEALAANYTSGGVGEPQAWDESGPRIGAASDRLAFPDWAEVNVVASLDALLSKLIADGVRPA